MPIYFSAQSGRIKTYSESSKNPQIQSDQPEESVDETDVYEDVIKINTDLIVVPVQIKDSKNKSVLDIKREEFKVFENGIEQEIAYFSDQDQPFTVALALDMSYSSVFKLQEIQAAAFSFVNQLRPDDKIMVVSFDEKVRVLCEPTNDRKVLKLAIEGAEISSGTSLYKVLDLIQNEKFKKITGRKAIVLLSDGVDTSSKNLTKSEILSEFGETDTIVYPVKYDTYDDVQKNRKENAEVVYDEKNRPYLVMKPKEKGEREEDYREANEFLKSLASQTGGSIYRVNSTTNLNRAFSKIANELRKTYSLGYYSGNPRKIGVRYAVNIRVYRQNLKIKAKDSYIWHQKKDREK